MFVFNSFGGYANLLQNDILYKKKWLCDIFLCIKRIINFNCAKFVQKRYIAVVQPYSYGKKCNLCTYSKRIIVRHISQAFQILNLQFAQA